MTDANTLIARYIELRDKVAEISKRVAEATAPFNDEMNRIEKDLMSILGDIKADNLKTEAGLAYKTTTRSVKMQDASAFKQFVFKDVIAHISGILGGDYEKLVTDTLLSDAKWDMIDFRAGKKGIVEHFESTGEVVPGVSFDQFTSINIRRA